ncbi:hypothetical protein O181_010746 [Austropuccinia psidii MF-1]|uniref:Uncharacterized protein n=1 Tax=Austropuccinia psidii MF-1 TaxID=1389203 RepID=A0A9Q3BRM0_9BASI|nr:hypothetical protein [Austropuccinia psidii MF-1]
MVERAEDSGNDRPRHRPRGENFVQASHHFWRPPFLNSSLATRKQRITTPQANMDSLYISSSRSSRKSLLGVGLLLLKTGIGS